MNLADKVDNWRAGPRSQPAAASAMPAPMQDREPAWGSVRSGGIISGLEGADPAASATGPKERPKLNLIPRSKPKEEPEMATKQEPAASAGEGKD